MKEVGIEEFAAWAVQEEWPKANSAEMDGHIAARAAVLSAMGMRASPLFPAGYGAMDWSMMVSDGSVPAVRVAGVVHPDAVLFSRACSALAIEASSPVYDADDCLSDQAELLAMGESERPAVDWRLSQYLQANRINPRSLVLTYAGLARRRRAAGGWEIERPDWHEDPIERGYARGDSGRGQPAWFVTVQRRVRVSGRGEPPAYEMRACEEEGLDPRLRRPRPGAYRKVVFDPDPAFVARARHTYAVWWCSLEFLAAWMKESGALSEHRLLMPQGVEKPWKTSLQRVA